MMPRIFHSLIILPLLVLAACQTPDIPFLKKDVILQCPNYLILEDAAALTQYREGPSRDITDVEFRAQIGEMELTCLTEVDPDSNSGSMTIEVSPIIAAEMGPANQIESATIPYFVIVTDPNKEILYREELVVDVSFKLNKTQVIFKAPPTSIEIPITPTIRSKYYLIYSGFELTPRSGRGQSKGDSRPPSVRLASFRPQLNTPNWHFLSFSPLSMHLLYPQSTSVDRVSGFCNYLFEDEHLVTPLWERLAL